jgi:hypothetical protein
VTGLDDELADTVVDVMSAVLSDHLMTWWRRGETMVEARAAIDRAVDLIFGERPGRSGR